MSSAAVVIRARRGFDRYGWPGLAKEAFVRPLRPALAPIAARRLHEQVERATGIDQLINLAFEFDVFGITVSPGQVRSEFRQFLELVAELRPRRMLEIGTANGGSLLVLAGLCAPDAKIMSIDLPDGEFGGGYPSWKLPIYRAFARADQQVELLRGDSHDPGSLAKVDALLGDDKLDLLFIDGDHTYDGVRRDFEMYSPLVRKGGLIAFHDINPPNPQSSTTDGTRLLVGEVPEYWAEIRDAHNGQEFVAPSENGCFGLGVIRT